MRAHAHGESKTIQNYSHLHFRVYNTVPPLNIAGKQGPCA